MKPRKDLIVRYVEGETVILDRSVGHLHTLNATASFIWHQMDGNKTEHDIAREVSDTFNIEFGVAEKDVATVINDMRDLKLMQNGG